MSMKSRFLLSALGLSLVLAMSPSFSAPSEQDFQVTLPENVVWRDAGRGVKLAVSYGDPSKPGQYVIRAYFPPGVMSSPHFHGEDRHVTVIQGTWNAGKDDSWDPEATVPPLMYPAFNVPPVMYPPETVPPVMNPPLTVPPDR